VFGSCATMDQVMTVLSSATDAAYRRSGHRVNTAVDFFVTG
jgi:hypothetical protein